MFRLGNFWDKSSSIEIGFIGTFCPLGYFLIQKSEKKNCYNSKSL